MESGPGSPGGCHSRTGLQYPSWSILTRYLQGALMFIIFTTHFQSAAADRDESIILWTPRGAWNKALYKTERNCSDFHFPRMDTYFYYWPEDNPQFDHCCTYNKTFYSNYTYNIYGPELQYMTYYDLGLIDQCLPYWKCLHLFEEMYKIHIYYGYCEFNDLRNFYKQRFWSDTVLKRGLLQSTIPFILCSEILVILSVTLYWFIWRRRMRANGSRDIPFKDIVEASKNWLWGIRKTFIMDWIHLCLLAIVGNGLIDAVGHQDAYTALSKSFYNYGRLYVVLSILVWYSSVLHQISSWIAVMEVLYEVVPTRQSQADSQSTPVTSGSWASLPRHPSVAKDLEKTGAVLKELEETIGLNADWKWQPIAAQVGILFCVWGYLTYSSDDTAGGVLGIIVQAACPWSGLYATKVIIHALRFLLRRVYKNLFKPRRSYRGLWRSVMHLRRWPGNGRPAGNGLAQPQDTAAFLELEENGPPV